MKQLSHRAKRKILGTLCCSLLTLFVSSEAQEEKYSLRQCIETGLERNYSIRIIRNEQQISDNNATASNAGYLPTLDLNGGISGTLDKNHTSTAGVNLNWTLFDGLGIQATYQHLGELQRLGELNTRITIEDFTAGMAGEYYNLIRQQIRLRNLTSSLELSKERLRIVEQRYYIGSMSRLDLQQAQVDFNSDSSKVLDQRQVVHRSHIRLNELMALDNIEENIRLQDSRITPNPFLDEADLWRNTLEANTALLLAEKNNRLTELDYKKAKSRNYPYLALNAAYGSTLDSRQHLDLTYGLTLGYNLDGMQRRREQRNARLQIRNSQLRHQELELSLRATMSNLWMAYRNNLELWQLEQANLIAAQEYYAIAIDRYRLGDLSGIELREAQNNLFEAEERHSIAQYNTKLCEISLLQLSGQILTYFMAAPNV